MPEFYANATLSSPDHKHYISMCLDTSKTFASAKICHKNIPSINPKVLELIYNIFQIYNYIVRCSECQILIKAQKYRCQFYLNIAIGSQNSSFIMLPILKKNKNKNSLIIKF